ncbi:nebulin isoform X28 [Emydura macquarii macquarii]|uniref:nebulin isoform X28 n=1 Tax=Emydura macquarii macquarii TaxID=1129001 RepID=UPI00352AF86D
MADEEEYEEVVEYYVEETVIEEGEPMEVIMETTTTTTTTKGTTGTRGIPGTTEQPALPVRKRVKRTKVDSSKFMTPYLQHSHKMQELFSQNKYKQNFEKEKGKPYASTVDTPELRRIKKVQDQLSEVKYRMDGDVAKTICHVDEKAKDIEHAKKVSQQVSKVLYKQNWEENKDKYLLPPDAPELVQAVKNTAMFSKKLYTEDWEQDKTLFYPYNDSPELRRVAKAQKALSDIVYKKGHDEQKSKYTSLPDPPDVQLAKKVTRQLSDCKYREDYKNKIKGKWSQTPCYEVAVARMNADNFSTRKYQEDYELMKDQIYFMQTETPEYQANKRVGIAASKVKYKEDYEKSKASTDYNVLPATQNPLLKQLKVAGNQLSDKLYKEAYEKSKATSINYCDTPKFQVDSVLKNFSDIKYKDAYQKNILGHYIGSYEDPYHTHYMNVAAMKSDKNYKADYEEDKAKCYFPQTITQEYDVIKKLDQCKDNTYKKHADQIKFTQVTDSPVQIQAQINSKQLSDLNYKAKHESEKFKCHIPPDAPLFLQSRVNAYNLSDNWYKYDWERSKDKKFEIKVDAIPLLAAKANSKIASDVAYKKDYELGKGKMIGALSIHDDPKILHSAKVAKQQSDHEYKKGYELSKSRYTAPLDMIPITQAKISQAIASSIDYKHPLHNYSYPPDSINVELAKKAYSLQSDNEYKSDYNSWMKGCGWIPFGSMEAEKAKRASNILNEKKYRQHPNTIKFTQIEDEPVIVQAKINQAQRSDILYKAKNQDIIHKYHLPPDVPQFIQAKVNAYNISDNYYKMDMEELKSKGYDLRNDAIPIRVAKAAGQAASNVHYKKDYELAKGKLVGFQSLQDDPKLVHYMKVAKMQSDREYKKDYETTKTKYNIPLDMVNVVAAKQAQDVASNVNYKQLLHNYTYLPDAMNLKQSKNMMRIQSDHAYKEDYDSWMKGLGWIPIGSLDIEKARKAGEALNEKKYRQHPDTIKFTSVVDSPVMVQDKKNALQLNDRLYKSSGEEIKHKYTMTPDVPQFIQARYNAANISDAYYKQDYHDLIAKGHNVLGDAIPFALAKRSRNIASDYKYKEAYEKAKGKHVGFRSLQDDPKLVHYMKVAKLQSDREYKKDYEETKTNYHTPANMFSIQAAKQSQDIASNANYKHLIHHYTYLPDAMDVELAKNMMQIQSNNLYKQDYNSWFKGIGWSPLGSLDVEKVRKAGDALNENKYRQHPDTIKFTSIPDSMPMVLAQHNTKQLSEINYKQEGEKLKHKYTLDTDVPQFIQARVNALNMSDAYYTADWKKIIAKGYDLKPDAISVIAAKASRNIASDYKYKESYEKEKGKHVGFRSLQDDPKLVHYMNVAKMQSEREYKKDYESSKTKYHTPLDMFSVTAAKKAQEAVTNTNYKQLLHNYTLLPDAMNVQLSRNMMQIQSENLYKTDFNNWLRGVGWMPIQSLDVEKAKKATDILSEKKYRQHPDKLKYSIKTDAMEQVLAKQNAQTMNKRLYTDKWNKEKTSIHVMPDTPEILQSRVNQISMSDKLYRAAWEEDKKKGYDMQSDAIPIKAAKASRDIASDYKYKQAYEQARGKHIGFRSLEDDPKLVHFMKVAKMQSDREYKKDYEKSKTRFHTPADMFSVVAAKKAQDVVTNTNYKQLIHHYNVLPDAMNLELAKNMMQIQSNNQYKADYDEFMKGVGWISLGSLEAEKNKKAMEIISEKKYRQHPDKLKYSSLMDSMDMVLATNNAKIMDKHLYKQAWEADKTKVHIMPDIPEIALAKVNAFNISDKIYKHSLEESRRKGYDLRADAIPIKAAKASRDIASDYKYKLGYEMDKGKLVGFRSLQDDPKLVHYMQVAKMQSDREYRKAYEISKTSYHTPADTLSIRAAKEAQGNITNTNYKRLIHKYILLPDAINVELTRNMNRIQSDNKYKQDYNEWYKGLGWSPAGSLDVEKSKKATEIASDRQYRQHPSLFPFTKQSDSMDMMLAKHNANVMNQHIYTEAWEKDKLQIHVMPDTPDILQAKQNMANYSQKLYKQGWEEMLKKGYDLTPEAISVKSAKASRDIASDYKYKEGYRKQQGHHIGFRSIRDDPKLVLSMNVAKMQSEREYKKDFEKWKTKFNMPVDMLGFLLAKKCQSLVSDVDYRRILHQWTSLPDQTSIMQAKKVYEIQSDNVYKSDLQWLKGLGWSPYESLEAEKNKKASEILSEKKYRQPPDTVKFTSIPDAMDIVLAKSNAKNRSDRLYREAWDKDKTQIHIMPDTPEIILAKANLINTSDKLYKLGYEELKKKGYELPPDAISLKSAKASRNIASEYKYKEGYRKQLGHHVGARNIQDDPKMVWSMHVAKIQSDREYKKDFEKWKTKYNSPVDMLGVVLAKKCQELVSDIDYRHPLHKWTCLPDQKDLVHARTTYDLQSDLLYKSDLQWLRGIGWSPSGSLDDEKNRRATHILSDHTYRQHPDTIKFSSLLDSLPMVLAKHNSQIMNQRSYTEAWNKDKTSIHIMPDTPDILLAQQNKLNYSEKLYRLAMEEEKKKGYDLRADAIPIRTAKASRDIASEYKYRAGYRKQLGHHVGARNIQDDPKMVWSMHVAKIQSDREYKKDFEKWKTKYNTPVDMLGIVLAKKCQELVSEVDYRHPLHQWTCLPDQSNVVHARKTYDLQSDLLYKSDLQWLRGIGWSPSGSLDDEKNKRATHILSDHTYRQHPDTIKFSSLLDSLPMVLAKHNSQIMNQLAYKEAWNKDKTSIHIMPDTPDILLAQQNKLNYSEKLYRLAMEEEKKKGYDLRADAIPIRTAKASRDIASEYKYKEGYRKQLGHHVGARNIQDDPKMVWSMHVAKIQSDREYKKDFEKWKTKYNTPVDMLGIILAKKCQELVSEVDYRHPLHQWTCLPDQNDVVHARKTYDLQSDLVYKSDLQWLRGIGWSPSGSLDDEKNKRATHILSDHTYRQHPDTIKFSSLLDSLPMVLAKHNSVIMNQRAYTDAWNKDKTSIHIMPDTPDILLAQQNKLNYSEKLYRLAMEEEKKKGYDLRTDAIPIRTAKASRDIASEYKYKEGYRKQLGHHVGARNIQDDPKMVWSMHVAKIQSDREYKKDFEKWKTKYNTPVDMLGIVLAKKCQELVSEVDYRHPLHQWTCLPDQNDVVHARKTYDLQSDLLYKSDLQWLRGIGWSPSGSLDDEKNKRATHILSDHTYRQHPDTIKFSSLLDSLPMVLAKHNSVIMNQRAYTEAWNNDKTSIHIMPDTPGILLAQQNKLNYSEKLYRLAMEEDKKKGYDLRADAIPIRAAKASRDIASEYKYKEGYRKQLGHHVGARNIQDDPKMMWSMHVAKIQSDREYKKDFEKWKTKYNSPVDMLGIVLAKKCQELVSDVDYRHPLHQWTCLPDQNDVIHARKAYELQSDNCYKSDLQWLRGIGWVPIGSLDVEKAKKAGEILSDNIYRQSPDKIKFTSVTDSLEMVLAKHNAEAMNKRLYTEAWDKDKTQIHMMPDTPEITLARQNKLNYSQSLYKLAMEEAKKRGYDLRIDAIPIKTAKASRDIASDYKYKEGYRKQLGHHVGARNIQDDPKMVWSMHVAKIQSDREYKKDFEKWKTKYNSPVDMLGIILAKKCQELVSDIDYRHPLHQWTCLPDQNDVIHARKAYELQSDNYYKSDLQWLRGIGWVPIGSLDVEKVKKAGEILSDKIYRQPPDTFKFTSVTDSLEMVLAKQNADTMNKRLYTEAWDKDKTTIHVMPDTPEIMLAKLNRLNYSEKLYKLAMEELKKRGYDLRADAIPIQAAKASRNIASDYKYKEGYRKQLGHHVGARNIQDDPKMVWSMHVAKIQSDREYKKDFEKSKTKYSTPVDMLGIVQAKKCQTLVSEVDYKHYLHEWTCLPDQNDVIQAKKAYELQSDSVYKSDLEWLKGIGWVPIGSLDVEKAKKAGEILSEKQYRQPPDQIKFTSVTDSLELVLAKQNAETMNKRLYTEAWNADKTSIHVMPDTPEILLAKANSANVSQKLYTQGWEESKMRDYDLRADAIPIRSAKTSRDIASDYKYKEAYEKQRGHHVGARNIQDDPKMMWSIHAAKIQSDREYKKHFEKSKTNYSSPVDMIGIVQAKNCQTLVSDVDYRHYLHQWTCLPDQNDVIQAKKAYELQSDNVYKSDLEWLRGIGWMPDGSLDVDRVKKAQELLNERLYRQRPEELKFTSIVDAPSIVLAKINAMQISEPLYREAWDKEKTQFTLPTDTPQMLQSKINALNISSKHYQQAWEDAKMKDYDLRADAISIKHARSSRDIASEYKYKETHEKQKGHYIGCRTAKEDPKLAWAAHVLKMQNDREYRKAYHSSKARINIPVDMVSVQAAKQCQSFVSDVDYRQYLHQWTCLPDQNDVIQAKKAYDLQSDNVYKSDLEWLRGIGWMPDGSVDVDRVKKAQELLNNRLYRTRPDELKFTSIVDTPEIVLAKANALNQSGALYREVWDKEKTQFTLPSDTPEILQSRINAMNFSKKLYQLSWEEAKEKGYDLRADAIEIKHAKASRDIASEYKYKTGYRQQLGHYVGFQSLQDDPKLVWSIHAAKIQSDREYKKHFEKSKTNYSSPVDMIGIVQAKKCQTLVSDVDYRHYLHQWTCLPDQNDVIQAKKAYELQSDNVYKTDLEWLRGTGWLTEGCVDVTRVKKAQELLNDRLYRQRPDELKFTSIVDPPPIVLAKINALQISEPLYHKVWDKEKTQFTLPADTPVMLQSKVNALNVSNKHYQQAWEDAKMKDYELRADAISIKHAKASRDIASEYKYKETHEKQKGHYIGCRTAKEDPKLAWAAHVLKMQNDREYRKAYHSSKARINIPVDMVSVQAAKEGQLIASDVDYRQYLHQWTCLPDQNDVIQARKAYDLQSDALYKSDLEWLRGIGWMPSGSVEVNRVKNAQDILSEKAYRTPVESLKYTNIVDTPDVLLAKTNAIQTSLSKYREAWDKAKTMIHVMPDTPEINLAKANAIHVSNKLYKEAWDEVKMSCDLRADAIPIKAAKASREIASDYKYKLDHEKQKGHYIGTRNAREDNKIQWALHAAKLHSDLEYKKHFQKWKTKFSVPVDMLPIVAAKKCQTLVSDIDYRNYLHQWTCLPDQNDVIQAKKAYQLQSDAVYKSDLEWLRGIGWMPNDSVGINHVKHVQDLLNERKYRTKAETLKFTPVADRVDYITAKQSGEIRSDIKYHQDWNAIKSNYTLTDTPQQEMAREAARILNQNLYKESWEKKKATDYLLPPDAVQLRHAKHSGDVQSDLQYKAEYVHHRGHYVGVPSMREDPKLVWFEHAGKIQNDRLYKSAYHKSKSNINIPADMISVLAAKECQTLVSDIDYRQYLHEWTCHPDQNDCIQARKAYDLQSDNIYKSDLEWIRGCGWIPLDSVEHNRVKNAQELINKRAYMKAALDNYSQFTSVVDTPDVVLAKINSINQSDLKYKETFNLDRGHFIGSDDTPVLNHTKEMSKLYSDKLYKHSWETGKAIGYTLPPEYIPIVGAKHADYINSELKYKEAYEHIKAKGYTLGPKAVGFEHIKNVNKVLNERLYREIYHKNKDKIHTTPDTPEIRQVKATQEAISDLIYKADFFKMQGHLISLPYTPQVVHCRYVGDITSDNKYKQDLQWLRGLGCFLYDTPDMVRSRHLRELWSNYVYTNTAKKMRDKYSVVLDTPEYRKVQELKTHLSEVVYRAAGKKQKTKFTSILETPDFLRAKEGQKIQSQYLYVELATKERPHHHAGDRTPALTLAKHVKDMVSEKKYKTQYEKMKDKYTTVPDTPILIRAKKAYWNASDLRYKETFEQAKGKYHTVKDALDIVYHRKVTDDISSVKYKENYVSQLGIWRSIPDRPEHYHYRAVTDAISDVKYKEDLSWLRGFGCYAWDTPDLALAEKNKVLYSGCKYKESFEKMKSQFEYVADCPINRHFKHATQLMNEKKYKSSAKLFLQHGCNELLRPDMLTALYNTNLWSQFKYKRQYEMQKDKYTSIVDTPEHLRTAKVNKQISDIIYKMEFEKAKSKGYTTIHDTPILLLMRKVKDRISDLKYKEVYEKNKSHCNVVPDAVHIKAAKAAYKVNSNRDYKKQYEATKARWEWTVDRPDFLQAAKASLQQSDYDYKLDREFLRGCKLSVTDDKNTVLALKNAILASDIKYKEKHNRARGTCLVVPDTPQILLSKCVSSLVSENKYKEQSKKQLPHGSYTTLPQTRDTVHVKEVTKNVSETNYKKKFVKEKGKSNYSIMLEPPEVKHAMEVAKKQSIVEYKKDAKSQLHYTSIADRPDIKKATQVAKLVSEIQYKAKARGEAGLGVSMLGRPDIELAKEVSKLTSQLKYKENFDKEKGKKPKYDLKEAKIYKTMKDAHNIASEVKYKADLKKLHKPVTDMSESLIMNHVLSTSQLSSAYQYKKQYEKSKGHYHVVPDNLEQLHLKEASELQSQVKYKERYEKEKGKPMLDFETPTYITAKEAQHMQSEKEYKKDYEESIKGRNLTGLEITPSLLHVKYATKIASEKEYRRDLEEGVRGKGMTMLEETPDMLRAKNATQILNEKEYKKALELEIKGRGLTDQALETPDYMRAKNATDIASQIKYKHLAEMDKANYTSVVDTPEIIHAQQVKNLSSQKKYKEDAERTMSYYLPVLDTPEMQRVRENQKNFSTLQYQWDVKNSQGKITVVQDTPEILRVKENQKNFSSILYKEDIGTGTAIEKTPEMQRIKRTQDAISTIKYKESIGKGIPISDLPEVKRVKETQKHISSVLYKEDLGTGIPIALTPEIERVKRNQEHISTVLYKEGLGTGIPTPVTPEMERVKRNQEIVSSVLYKENLGTGTPTPVTPEIERVKRNQENFSSVLYKENLGTGTPTPVTPEIERVKRNQENFSLVLYKENLGTGTPIPVTPEIERVKRNQENFSSVLYKENIGKATPTPVTPEMERVKRNQETISSVLYKELVGKATPTPVTPEMERVKRNQEHISSVLYKENLGRATPTPVTPEMERVKRNQENISSVMYKENLGKATPTPVTPEMERVKRNQENISLVLYKEHMGKGTPTPITPEMERAKRNQENISSVLYSDSFRKQVQGKAAYVLDTPEMRRVRETQRHISTVKYHEDFEKHKGSFTPVVTDPITERVKKNMQDFSDINYRGMQRRVVEMERKRVDQDQETLTGLRVWRTNPGSVFDYDPAEDNIQSRSLHMISVQAQRRSREQSRSASALSLNAGDQKSEHSEGAEHHLSYYSNGGFFATTTTVGYKQAKTVELPQQRSSSVATQLTAVSSVPSHPSTTGKTYRAMYDYMAADADEVSFKDGDAIVNVQAIDEGWMYGTVQRTGKTGMLPANYVEAL